MNFDRWFHANISANTAAPWYADLYADRKRIWDAAQTEVRAQRQPDPKLPSVAPRVEARRH